jgi:uncharacterized protein YdhG (YjbR/CyaY superfamily)
MKRTLSVDEAAQAYIDDIAPEFRPLFDRFHHVVSVVHPTAKVVFVYRMPTYKVGERQLHVAVWKHGLSIYGCAQGGRTTFTERHPLTKTSKGTIRLSPNAADDVSDDELADLVRAALDD